jgi:hypothetical protein
MVKFESQCDVGGKVLRFSRRVIVQNFRNGISTNTFHGAAKKAKSLGLRTDSDV